MLGDLGGNHVPLALANRRHVDRAGLERPAVFRGVTHEMGDPRARDLVLARHAGDVGTGAADPFAFDGGSPPSGCCHLPGDELAASSAAEDENVVPFGLGHGFLHSMLLFACARPIGPQPVVVETGYDEVIFAVRYMTRHLRIRKCLAAKRRPWVAYQK